MSECLGKVRGGMGAKEAEKVGLFFLVFFELGRGVLGEG